jgi:hypothetical protein
MLVRLFLGFCMVIPRGDGGNSGVVIVTVLHNQTSHPALLSPRLDLGDDVFHVVIR